MNQKVPAKRGPYARSRKLRQDIARVVLDLVEANGHESITVAEVAARSATSEATLLYHFPSKDHLLLAALELSDQEQLEASRVEGDGTGLSWETFRQSVEAGLRDDPIRRLLKTLQGAAAAPDHPAAEYLQQRRSRQVEIFELLLARRQRDGLAHPSLDPRLTAIELLALWDGLTAFWLDDPDFDIGGVLIDAARRLTGENVMHARALIQNDTFGL